MVYIRVETPISRLTNSIVIKFTSYHTLARWLVVNGDDIKSILEISEYENPAKSTD